MKKHILIVLMLVLFYYHGVSFALPNGIYGEYNLSVYNNFKKGFPLATFLRNQSFTIGYVREGLKIYGQYNWVSHVSGENSHHYYSPVAIGVEARTGGGGYDLFYLYNFVNKEGEKNDSFLRLQYIRTLGNFPLVIRGTSDWYLTKKDYKTTAGFSYFHFFGQNNILTVSYKFNEHIEDYLGIMNPWVISYYRDIRNKVNLEFKYSPRKDNHVFKSAFRVKI